MQSARLADGRLHLQHGPIDLIIEAFGAEDEIERAYLQAQASFVDLLQTLVDELTLLRHPVSNTLPTFSGPVAQRMAVAVWPHRAQFITPMAAVAGAVADDVLEQMIAGRTLKRAYVNNGGDIALYLDTGEVFQTGLVSRLDSPHIDGVCRIPDSMPVRGIATSGRGGRSFSLGIADAVTVLAANAATADAAATLIANAVTLNHPAIQRVPATDVDDNSDLGNRLVTVAVDALDDSAITQALEAGLVCAQTMQRAGLIYAAVLFLQGHYRLIGEGIRRIAQ